MDEIESGRISGMEKAKIKKLEVLAQIVFIVCVFTFAVLTAGEPDLLDAIIKVMMWNE